jgi:hypothetical protein
MKVIKPPADDSFLRDAAETVGIEVFVDNHCLQFAILRFHIIA